MKKLLTVLLIVMMVAAMFTGCGKKEEVKTTLTVALSPDFSPMEFVDTTKTGQDQFVGFDVELAKYIAKEMGLTLEIKPMNFDACQAAVQAGAVDMSISGYSVTDDRKAKYNLSDFYYAGDNETKQTIIVPAGMEGQYKTAADFAGKTIAAQVASLQMDLCTSQLPEGCTIKTVTDIGTAVESLRNGMVDGIAVAEGNGKAICANNDKIAMSGFFFEIDSEQENNVVLLKKGADELTAQVNAILAKAYAAGLYPEWYKAAQELAGIDTSVEVGYDDNGNVAN